MDIQSITDAKVEIFINKLSREGNQLRASIGSDGIENGIENDGIENDSTESDGIHVPTATTTAISADPPCISVEADPYAVLQNPEPLRLLCPQCFGGDPVAELGFISLDGNFQHKRFHTKTGKDDKYLELRDKRLFIDDGTTLGLVCIHFLRCSDVPKDEAQDETITTCSRNFVAADEAVVNSKSKLADSGIMAAVCRCGSPLRLHNIRQTGEKGIYAVRLLQSILKDPSCPPKLMLSYDINCRFSKYVKVEIPFDRL